MYGAVMIAFNKKHGGVRSIAVGNIQKRFDVIVKPTSNSAAIGEALLPVRLGVSYKDEHEAAAQAGHRYLGETSHKRVIFKVDKANTFNNLWRDLFLGAEREQAQKYIVAGLLKAN